MHPVAILDIQRARKESKTRAYNSFQPTLILNPSLHAILEYIERCHEEKVVSFDVETYGPRIRCLGLAATCDTAICIPLKRGPVNVWPEGAEATIWAAVRRLFADKAVTKVAQNAQFDLHFLVPQTGFPVGPLFDTMLAHHLLHPELQHDLDFLTSVYTNIGYYGLGNVMRAPDMDCWIYNCHDVLATLIVKNQLVEELKHRKLHRFFTGYTMPLSVCLYEMQHRGVGIDSKARQTMIDQLNSEAKDLRFRLNEEAGFDLNPSSPKQLQEYFYGTKGYKANYNRKRHTVTVDRTALMKLAAEGSQVASTILDIRAREKLVSTFLDIPLAPDGRLHCEYVISGTVTGRLSSRAPLTGFGTNLQNIPRPDGSDSAKCGVRRVFVPKPGFVFVKGDLSQAENRVVAWLTKGEMKRAFEQGDDVHELTATMIGATRSVGKVVNHASNYGMGPGQLAALLNCDMGTARKYLDKYHYTYQGVHHWHERIRRQLAKDRTLRTPVGRVRKFLGRWGDELFRAAYSFIPQSLVADILNMGMLRLWLALKRDVPGAALVLQVHDEVVVECPREDAERVQQLLHESLEYPVIIDGDVLVIPVDSKILQENWLK